MSKPIPVFVIGMNRSGTKWLSNILCNHSEMIGVQSERHGGILETNMFDVMSQKFDLSNSDDYVGFIDLWSQSDFFRLTGVDKKMFLTKPLPNDFFAIFGALMDQYANQNKKRFWVQKTGPECGLKLITRFSTARFIVIVRDAHEQVKSSLQLRSNQRRQPSVFDAIYDSVAQTKYIKRILKQRGVLKVSYEQLLNCPQSVLPTVCDHLEINFESRMLDSNFKKNTSYKGQIHPSVEYATVHRTRLRLFAMLINLIPLSAMRMYRNLKPVVFGRLTPGFVAGTFAERTAELMEPWLSESHDCVDLDPPTTRADNVDVATNFELNEPRN